MFGCFCQNSAFNWYLSIYLAALNSKQTWWIIYLRVDEGSKNGDGGSERVDGLNGRLEDDDGRDDDRNPLHGVADAECQRWDLIQRHVGYLVVQVVEHALRRHPPTSTQEFLATWIKLNYHRNINVMIFLLFFCLTEYEQKIVDQRIHISLHTMLCHYTRKCTFWEAILTVYYLLDSYMI